MSQAFPILIKFLDKSKIYSSDFQTKEDFSRAWKNVLTNAYTDNAKLKCTCNNSGLTPLNIHYRKKSDSYFLAKDPGTGHKHRFECRFFEIDDEQSGKKAYLKDVIETKMNGHKKIRLFSELEINGSKVNRKNTLKKNHNLFRKRSQPNMSQLGLLHLLWEEARLNIWHRAMRGKRNPNYVSYQVREAAKGIHIRKNKLSSHLMVFGSTGKNKNTNKEVWKAAVRNSHRVVIISELGDQGISENEPAIRIDDFPGLSRLNVESDFHVKLRERFESALRHWRHGSRVVIVAQVEPESDVSGIVLQWGAMAVTQNWIPVESRYEAILEAKLVMMGRQFIKPMRFDANKDVVFPNFLLSDIGDNSLLPMEIYGTHTEECLRLKKSKESYYRRTGAKNWSWTVPTKVRQGFKLPPFPSSKHHNLKVPEPQ